MVWKGAPEMKSIVSSFVLRVSHSMEDNCSEDWRIRIRHVQSDEEIYLSSLDDVKAYIEDQVKHERELVEFRKGVKDDR
jgi:hypothetical protein